MLRRILFLPGLRALIYASNTLRFLAFRGMGAKVAFSTNMSTDADILDPSLFEAGPGAVIGARCFVSGHYIANGKLVLGNVSVGRNSLLAVDVKCAPDVVIGDRVTMKGAVSVSIGVRVEDDVSIGGESLLDSFVIVRKGVKTASRRHFLPRTIVEDESASREVADSKESPTVADVA